MYKVYYPNSFYTLSIQFQVVFRHSWFCCFIFLRHSQFNQVHLHVHELDYPLEVNEFLNGDLRPHCASSQIHQQQGVGRDPTNPQLTLDGSTAGSHSCCKVLTLATVPCPEDSFHRLSSSPYALAFFPLLPPCSQSLRGLVYMSCLGLSTQLSLTYSQHLQQLCSHLCSLQTGFSDWGWK